MIRKLHSAIPTAQRGGFHKLLGAALLAAAACAAPAHAGIITFDGDYVGPIGGGDMWEQAGYSVGFYANVPGDGIGNLVGQILDGNDSSCDTQSMACPANTSGAYYGAFDDSYLDIRFTAGAGFQLKSFDASFIGGTSSLSSYPNPPGLIRVQAFRANGSYLTQDFWLNGPTPTGFRLAHFNATGAFANTTFVEALMFGYSCNTSGSCSAFSTDKGQFAIDNITMSDVPEPATAAIVGLGLLGLGAARRRRNS
jgi:hypothetical protein